MAVPEGTADILERTKFVHKSTSSTIEPPQIQLPTAILDGSDFSGKKLPIGHKRTCQCGPTHINCMAAKEWLKSQLGVWQFVLRSPL